MLVRPKKEDFFEGQVEPVVTNPFLKFENIISEIKSKISRCDYEIEQLRQKNCKSRSKS